MFKPFPVSTASPWRARAYEFICALANWQHCFWRLWTRFSRFPGACEAQKRASGTQKRASETHKRACQQHAAYYFGDYEHVFPVFPCACEAHKRASGTHKRASEAHKRASETHKRASGDWMRRQVQTASCLFVLEAASTFLGQHYCCSSSGRTGKQAFEKLSYAHHKRVSEQQKRASEFQKRGENALPGIRPKQLPSASD